MENLDTIILAIGLIISFFFHWKQYQRETRKEKFDREELKKKKEKKVKLTIGNIKSTHSNVTESPVYFLIVKIKNIGYPPIFPEDLSLIFIEKDTLQKKEFKQIYSHYFPAKPIIKGEHYIAEHYFEISNFSPAKFDEFHAQVILTDIENQRFSSEYLSTKYAGVESHGL